MLIFAEEVTHGFFISYEEFNKLTKKKLVLNYYVFKIK